MKDLPELIVLDVGHGNCALLLDTEAVTVFDCPPTTTLLDALMQLDISTIDQVLISHADFDHASGLLALLDEATVRKVYINPDAAKKSKAWREIRAALARAETMGTEVYPSLTSVLSRKIRSGQIEIEILAPSSAISLGGAGGEDLEGRNLTSNSMSVVIGLMHNSHRVALLPGDMDEVGLDNLLKKRRDIEAQILIFPHHGGSPGNTKGYEFSQKLSNLVKPDLVIFSLERHHHFGPNNDENPRDDIMMGVVSAVPNAHIMCTQLSGKCAAKEPTSDFSHLNILPARGFLNNSCCGGTILIRIDGKQTTYIPLLSSHRAFISNSDNVPTPMCLQQLVKIQP